MVAAWFHMVTAWFHMVTVHGYCVYVLSTMGVSKESISKFLIGNRFRVKLRILSPYSNRILLRGFTWLRLISHGFHMFQRLTAWFHMVRILLRGFTW